MSAMTENELVTKCTGETDKVVLPDGLCALFLARLSAALPARNVVEADAQQAPALTLVVMRASPSNLVARIDQPGQVGEPLGTARADAPLDDTALARFFDQLIGATPLP